MKWWMWLIIEILVISWLFSACTSMFKEYKTVRPEFIHGSITEDGNHDFTDQHSICTKNIINCTKFRIDKDFDADYTVKIYFYNSQEKIVDIQEMSGTHFEINYATMPDTAVGIRVVLTRFVGFSDYDSLKFRYFDLGLSVSTRKQWIWNPFGWLEDFRWFWDPVASPGSSGDSSDNNEAEIDGQWTNGYGLSFNWGHIDNLGFLDADDKSAVYTQDLISCSGYRLTFYSGTDYLCFVHYYTADGRWLSSQVVDPGNVFTVKNGEMPCITEADGMQLSAAGIRICLVKIKTDFTGLNPSADEISFFEKQNADNCLTLDICSLSGASAA